MCDDLDLNPVNFVPAITAAINQQVEAPIVYTKVYCSSLEECKLTQSWKFKRVSLNKVSSFLFGVYIQGVPINMEIQ